jgi:hypothetical protein
MKMMKNVMIQFFYFYDFLGFFSCEDHKQNDEDEDDSLGFSVSCLSNSRSGIDVAAAPASGGAAPAAGEAKKEENV